MRGAVSERWLLRGAQLLDRAEPTDLLLGGGIIQHEGIGLNPDGARTLDLGGTVVLPGLVEAHIHLDKALLSARTPSREGTLDEAIRLTAEAKRGFTSDDIARRAEAVLRMAIRHGTTAMRTHVEVDPVLGLRGLEAIRVLKERYREAIDLQLVAFPQDGIHNLPGTESLLRQALKEGATVIGGCPYTDSDPMGHIRTVFDLAQEFDVDVDFHLDFFDDPTHLHIRQVVAETEARRWQGRVAVGHLTEVAALPPEERRELFAAIAGAGVGVIVLPATDLYLMGRRDRLNVRRGLAPVQEMLAAGITVAYSSNNIQNAFTPFGSADLMQIGLILAIAGHLGTDDQIRSVIRMGTEYAARLLRLPDYGLRAGGRGDLVVFDTDRPVEIIAGQPEKRYVFKGARLTVENRRNTRFHFETVRS